jgi:catechol 2,3-dioxygenase-like lactoylglutathione lyase family enzyme
MGGLAVLMGAAVSSLAELVGLVAGPRPTPRARRSAPEIWREGMTMRLDHTIVPAKDRLASAEFFAQIFGLTVKPDPGHFAQVQVNESLTLDFADEPEPWGGPGFDPGAGRSHHYAFHVSDAEFDAIFSRVKANGIPYGSEPDRHADGRINTRRGGRGFYFADPYGHLLAVMTVPETGG